MTVRLNDGDADVDQPGELHREADDDDEEGGVAAEARQRHHQVADHERAVALLVLDRVPRLVRGDAERCERVPLVNIRAEPQDLLGRRVVVGHLPGDGLDADAGDTRRAQECVCGFRAGVAACRRDLAGAVIGTTDPRLGP